MAAHHDDGRKPYPRQGARGAFDSYIPVDSSSDNAVYAGHAVVECGVEYGVQGAAVGF